MWGKVTERHAGIGWESILDEVLKGIAGNQHEFMYVGECEGYREKVRGVMEMREKKTSRRKVDEEGPLEIHRRPSEGTATGASPHSPRDSAKRIKQRYRVGDLDLSERL